MGVSRRDVTSDELKAAALRYADMGLAVFPLRPGTKYPQTTNGFKAATTDKAKIVEWWKRTPMANIGIATGAVSGGIVVIDLDEDEDRGISGFDTLRDWEKEHGALPETASSITGRGGGHLFYKVEEVIRNRTALLPGIDLRGDGGYIVAPPSRHSNGNLYEWEQDPEEWPFAAADDYVMELIRTGSERRTEGFQIQGDVGEGQRNDFVYRLACSLQSRGLSDAAIRATCEIENRVRCNPPLEDAEVAKAVKSALLYNKGENRLAFPRPKAKQFINLIQVPTGKKDENGRPIMKNKNCADNVATILREDEMLAGKLRYDKRGYIPKYFGQLPWHLPGDTLGDWSDFDDSNLRAYLDTEYGLKGQQVYEDGFNIVMNENPFDSVVDYLEALPAWDGELRIESLLPRYLGVKRTEYQAEVMRLFMLGAIARAYEPGCKFDYMLVIVGAQGVGKSEFLHALALNDMWFDDNLSTVEGPAAVEKLRGKWILELAELMAVKRQKDVESIKAFITTRADNYRAPYSRRTTDRKRRCVFAGTTNDYHFLTDRTGNRRFLAVEADKNVHREDLFAEEAKNYFIQCWAEALHAWKTEKPRLILSASGTEAARQMQMNFLEEDPWVGMIQEFLDKHPGHRVCAPSLYVEALHKFGDPLRADGNRIHRIMQNDIQGWVCVGQQRCGDYGRQKSYESKEALQNYGFMEENSKIQW